MSNEEGEGGGPPPTSHPSPSPLSTSGRRAAATPSSRFTPLPHSWDVADGGQLHRLARADWDTTANGTDGTVTHPLSPFSPFPGRSTRPTSSTPSTRSTNNRFAPLADSSDSEDDAEEGRVLEVAKRRLWNRLCPYTVDPLLPPLPRSRSRSRSCAEEEGEEEGEEGGEEECPICMEPLDITAYSLPCGHVFCFACIARHLSQPLSFGTASVVSSSREGGVRSRARGCPMCSRGMWGGFATLRHILPQDAVRRLPRVRRTLQWAYKQDGVWWWYAPRVSAALEAAYQAGETGVCVFVGMRPVTVWWDWSSRARGPHRRVRGEARGQLRSTSLPPLSVRRVPPGTPFCRAIAGIAGLWFPP